MSVQTPYVWYKCRTNKHGQINIHFSRCLSTSSMSMRNCCSWGWLSSRVRPILIEVSIRPLMAIFSILNKLDRSTDLHKVAGIYISRSEALRGLSTLCPGSLTLRRDEGSCHQKAIPVLGFIVPLHSKDRVRLFALFLCCHHCLVFAFDFGGGCRIG